MDTTLLVKPSTDPAAVPVDNELVLNDQAEEVLRQKVAVVTSDDGPVEVVVRPGDLDASLPANVAVADTSEVVVAASAARHGLVVVNVGSKRISLGLDGNAAVLDAGITLNPNGGTWVMDDRTFTTGAVAAVADTGGSSLAVQEFTA